MRTLQLRVTAVEDIGFRIERRRWFGWALVDTAEDEAVARARALKEMKDWRLLHPLRTTVVAEMSRTGR